MWPIEQYRNILFLISARDKPQDQYYSPHLPRPFLLESGSHFLYRENPVQDFELAAAVSAAAVTKVTFLSCKSPPSTNLRLPNRAVVLNLTI